MRQSKGKYELKSILKQKLLNYQNQGSNENQILIYDGYLTSRSDKLDHNSIVRNTIQVFGRATFNNDDNNKIYNYPTWQGIQHEPMKSLTRSNIHTINKKSRLVRSGLNEMSKKRYSAGILESSNNVNMQERYFSPLNVKKCESAKKNPQQKQQYLEIKNSNKPQSQDAYQCLAPSSSIRLHKPQRPSSSTLLSRPKSSRSNPPTPQLTQYFSPHYHRQTQKGYIINQFQPKMKVKHFQDNVKVMATLMKRKINLLQGTQILEYVKRIGSQKTYHPNNNQKLKYTTLKTTMKGTIKLNSKNK